MIAPVCYISAKTQTLMASQCEGSLRTALLNEIKEAWNFNNTSHVQSLEPESAVTIPRHSESDLKA
jgi:hypothetical protein